MKLISVIRTISILAVIAAGIGYVVWKSVDKGPEFNLGKVTRGDLLQRVTISGTVTPHRKTIVSAPYSGYVRKIFVEVGQKVKAGDPIVSIAQTLRGGDSEIYPLRAPISGTVVQVLRAEGEFVEQTQNAQNPSGGNGIVRIDDLSQLNVEASVPEIEVGKLKIGQEALVKASAVVGKGYQGRIDRIFLSAKEQADWDKSRVEFPVQVALLNHDDSLKPGMSVVIDILTKKVPGVLMLRHEFIQKDGEEYFVISAKGDRMPIQVGAQNEEVFEIVTGLKEGDRLRQTDFLTLLQEE